MDGVSFDNKEDPMRLRVALVCSAALALATAAAAQTRFSGISHCPTKPAVEHALPVGDRPDHALVISQSECPWAQGAEIGGVEVKKENLTEFGDVTGNAARVRGYSVVAMANGDKLFVSYQGTGALKDNLFQSGDGTWSFVGGSGKFKSLKGKGTWKCRASGDTVPCTIEGEYQLATTTSNMSNVPRQLTK